MPLILMRTFVATAVAAVLLPTGTLLSQRVVFEGVPIKKAEVSFETTNARTLTPDDAFEAQVRIVERNGRYYWQSRGMKELARAESGAYITYTAVDGSGYVRVYVPMMLDLREALPKEQRDREIGYTEHLLIRFASITYFGNRTPQAK